MYFIMYIYFCFQTQTCNKGYCALLVENINSTPSSLRSCIKLPVICSYKCTCKLKTVMLEFSIYILIYILDFNYLH